MANPVTHVAAVDAMEDEVVYAFFKKEKIKKLKRKFSASELSIIKVDYMGGHNIGDNGGSLKSKMKAVFGDSMDDKLVESIVLRPTKRPARHITDNNAQGRVLFTDSIETDKRNGEGLQGKSDTYGNCSYHKKSPIEQPIEDDVVICSQVPKPQHQEKSPEVVIVKEISSEERMKQMTGAAELFYNQSVLGSKGARAGTSYHVQDKSPKNDVKDYSGMSFVSGQVLDIEGQQGGPDLDFIINNPKFPVTAFQRKVFVLSRFEQTCKVYCG